MEFVLELLAGQAGDDARGTLLGDSSGFSIMKYEDWEDAKRGIISRLEFNKLHILVAPHGRIVTCAVTAGRRHDSPVFREMYGRIPQGSGHAMLDAAYLCREQQGDRAQRAQPGHMPEEKLPGRGGGGSCTPWAGCSSGATAKGLARSTPSGAWSRPRSPPPGRCSAQSRVKAFHTRQLRPVPKCICYNLAA